MVSNAELKQMSKCQKCGKMCFNVSILLAFISFMFVPILHSYSSSWNYVMKVHSWDLVQGFGQFFLVIFAFFYFGASLTILCRFYSTRRLCRVDNCSFYITSIGIFTLAMVGISYIDKANEYHKQDFSYTCAQLSLDDDIPSDSFLKEVNHIYRNASSLLCNQDCPCGLRDGVGGIRLLSEFDDYTDGNYLRQLRVFKDENGPTSVDQCPAYIDKVMQGDEDKQWQFEDAFAMIERDSKCSGICNGIEDQPVDFYLFSNINDGIPTKTCKSALSNLVEENIWYFQKLYLSVAVFTGVMLSIVFLILVCSCWLYCRRKCCGKKKNDKKKRANNGMVVGEDDQSIPDNSGVEMAEQVDNSDKKMKKGSNDEEKGNVDKKKKKEKKVDSQVAQNDEVDPRD